MSQQLDLQQRLENEIRIACSPHGDPVSLREREKSTQRLLSFGISAYEQMVKRVRDKPDAWEAARLIEIIGLFEKPESIGLLKELMLRGKENTSRAAGRAIAKIDSTAARQALKDGLNSELVEVRIAAIDAVRLSRDSVWCSFLNTVLKEKDANVRYYAINTAAELGCLDYNRLIYLSKNDNDQYVRELALKLSGNLDLIEKDNKGA